VISTQTYPSWKNVERSLTRGRCPVQVLAAGVVGRQTEPKACPERSRKGPAVALREFCQKTLETGLQVLN
jgi:hypothetical protein